MDHRTGSEGMKGEDLARRGGSGNLALARGNQSETSGSSNPRDGGRAKRRTWVRWFWIGLVVTGGVGFVTALCRTGDPEYEWHSWMSLGRFDAYDGLIFDVALESGVDPLLVKAIIWRVSEFESSKRDRDRYGLMQVPEESGVSWAAVRGIESFMATDLFDPDTNLKVGCWRLKQMLTVSKDAADPESSAVADFVQMAVVGGNGAALAGSRGERAGLRGLGSLVRGAVNEIMNRRAYFRRVRTD